MNPQEMPLASEDETAQARQEAYRAKQVERLDRLFRQAGAAFETRLVYQVVLDFQMCQRPVA
jgi:hypothetical protein